MGLRRASAEFWATGLFFVLGLSALNAMFGWNAWQCWGAALAVTVLAFGRISGAHVNPAVTIGLVVGRRFPAREAVPYLIAQLLGGIVAVLVVIYATTDNLVLSGAQRYVVSPEAGLGVWEACKLEALGTFLLVLVVIVATDRRNYSWASWLLIGGALAVAVAMIGRQTGGAINPARALAPFVVAHSLTGLGYTLVAYVLGPAMGGALAGAVSLGFKE